MEAAVPIMIAMYFTILLEPFSEVSAFQSIPFTTQEFRFPQQHNAPPRQSDQQVSSSFSSFEAQPSKFHSLHSKSRICYNIQPLKGTRVDFHDGADNGEGDEEMINELDDSSNEEYDPDFVHGTSVANSFPATGNHSLMNATIFPTLTPTANATSSAIRSRPLHLDYLTDSEDSILSTLMGDFTLAPASQIAYFYLHATLGLSDETMWKITLERGSILGLTATNLQAKVDLLRLAMELSDEDIRIILHKQPSMLQLSASLNLAPTMEILMEELQLTSKAQLRSMVLQYPSILCYSIQNLQRKIRFFTKVMGYTIDDTRALLLQTPQLLTLSVDTGLKLKYDFFRKEFQMSRTSLQRMMRRNPRIFASYSLQNNLIAKLIGVFIMKLSFEPLHVSKILDSYPLLLDRSLDQYLVPFTNYFLQDLMFSPLELRTILVQFPKLLSYSLLKVKYVVGYLRYEVGFTAEQVKRIFFQAPQVVCLKDEHLKLKINFLRTTFQFHEVNEDEHLKKIIAGMPSILKCSIENNLRPKAEYLLRAFQSSTEDFREAILLQPTLLGYSLEKRIKPRMELIQQYGLPPRKITIAITLKEENFESWLVSQTMSPEEKAAVRQQRKNQQRAKEGYTDSSPANAAADEKITYGKKIVDEAGRIVSWSRPIPKT